MPEWREGGQRNNHLLATFENPKRSQVERVAIHALHDIRDLGTQMDTQMDTRMGTALRRTHCGTRIAANELRPTHCRDTVNRQRPPGATPQDNKTHRTRGRGCEKGALVADFFTSAACRNETRMRNTRTDLSLRSDTTFESARFCASSPLPLLLHSTPIHPTPPTLRPTRRPAQTCERRNRYARRTAARCGACTCGSTTSIQSGQSDDNHVLRPSGRASTQTTPRRGLPPRPPTASRVCTRSSLHTQLSARMALGQGPH